MSEFIGKGSQFILNDDPSVPVTVTKITSIEFSGSKADAVETTNFGTSGTDREYMGGLTDQGDCTVKGNWVPGDTTQTSLHSYFDGDVHDFQVVYPDSVATESFSGIVTAFDKTIPLDKEAEFTCKIKVSGARTIA
jgi:predicted secreted protein